MFTAKSYLGSVTIDRGAKFVPLEEFMGTIAKPRHIDGGIEMTVDGKPLLTLEMWDLLDQLWIYLLQGVEKVTAGMSYRSGFPDSATQIVMTPVSDGRIEVVFGENKTTTLLANFAVGVATSAKACLLRLQQLLGQPEYYASEIAIADRLIEALSQPAELGASADEAS
jgi:hypothetical protein